MNDMQMEGMESVGGIEMGKRENSKKNAKIPTLSTTSTISPTVGFDLGTVIMVIERAND